MAAYGMDAYFNDDHEIREPLIPFYGIIPERLRPGSVIKIKGKCNAFCDRFSVNLVAGSDIQAAAAQRADIAFHFNPRWSADSVIKNHCQGGVWGQECREPEGRLPFSRMGGFKMEIIVEDRMYRIAVDGHHFAEFVHRIPAEYVGILAIDGDVSISKIKFGHTPLPSSGGVPHYMPDGRSQYPSSPPSYPTYPPQPSYPSAGSAAYPTGVIYPPSTGGPRPPPSSYPASPPSYPPYTQQSPSGPFSGSSPYPPAREGGMYPSVNPPSAPSAPYAPYTPDAYAHSEVDLKHPPTPFHYRFPEGLRPGSVIEILGAPTMYGQRFHIDLIRGPDVVGHTSVRIPERAIVRNVLMGGGWGYEEADLPSYNSFDFAPQREFHLVYRIGGDRVEVTLNGQFLFAFRWRNPFDMLDAISIEGDVKLDDIRIDQ